SEAPDRDADRAEELSGWPGLILRSPGPRRRPGLRRLSPGRPERSDAPVWDEDRGFGDSAPATQQCPQVPKRQVRNRSMKDQKRRDAAVEELPPPPERLVDTAAADPTALLSREWLVANGLGGYACGTLVGVATRRYHGMLVAALPA